MNYIGLYYLLVSIGCLSVGLYTACHVALFLRWEYLMRTNKVYQLTPNEAKFWIGLLSTDGLVELIYSKHIIERAPQLEEVVRAEWKQRGAYLHWEEE